MWVRAGIQARRHRSDDTRLTARGCAWFVVGCFCFVFLVKVKEIPGLRESEHKEHTFLVEIRMGVAKEFKLYL